MASNLTKVEKPKVDTANTNSNPKLVANPSSGINKTPSKMANPSGNISKKPLETINNKNKAFTTPKQKPVSSTPNNGGNLKQSFLEGNSKQPSIPSPYTEREAWLKMENAWRDKIKNAKTPEEQKSAYDGYDKFLDDTHEQYFNDSVDVGRDEASEREAASKLWGTNLNK